MKGVKVLSDKEKTVNKKSALISYLTNNEFAGLDRNTNSNTKQKLKESVKNEENTKEINGISLAESFKSSIKSSNKEKIDWLINQNIKKENTIAELNKEEIEFLIDLLLEKLNNQKSKLNALAWLEEILKCAYRYINNNKLDEIKSALKPHTLNYEVVLEAISKFEILEEICNKFQQKTKKSNDVENKKSSKAKENGNTYINKKHKVNLIYNESDSEEESRIKKKESIINKNKIENKKKKNDMLSKLKSKSAKNQVEDLEDDDEEDYDNDDSIYDDTELMDIEGDNEQEEDEDDEFMEEDDE